MKVRVYYNLHKECWSVQHFVDGHGWRLFSHNRRFDLFETKFSVSKSGRDRVLREHKKNVHAYVIGYTFQNGVVPLQYYSQERIRYNPYQEEYFFREKDGKKLAVEYSPWVSFHSDGTLIGYV